MERIAIDQDQVVADILSEWLRRYNNDYNDNLNPEQITHWNWHELTKPECQKKIYTYLDDPDLFANLPVIEGSVEAIRKLSEKYEIFFVTAPFNPNNIIPKYEWLLKYFGFIPEKNYVFVRNKSIIKADFMIDDKPLNLQIFEGTGRLLFDAPHNQNETKYIRLTGWNDALEYFKTYEQLEEYM